MPQCEGARNRPVFSGVRVECDPFVTVLCVAADGKTITLGAGLVHGLRPGTQLALYPSEVRTRAELPEDQIATVEVFSVAATRAEARVHGQPASPIPHFARAVGTLQSDNGLRRTVRLEGSGATPKDVLTKMRSAVTLATSDGQPSPYIRIEDDRVPVDLVGRADDGRLRFR